MATRSEVLVIILLGMSTNGQDPPPPPEGKEYTWADIMKNPEDCPLNSGPPFTWLVRVWDIGNQTTVAHGALFTFHSVLTNVRSICGDLGCFWGHEEHARRFEVIGQTIYNLSQPDKPCSQTRKAKEFYAHPKHLGANMTFFDFGIFILENAFNYSSPAYPMVAYSALPIDLLKEIREADENEIPAKFCWVQVFTEQRMRMPILHTDHGVRGIPFKTECVNLLCEHYPVSEDYNENYLKMCKKRFGERANYTMLCMKPVKSLSIGVAHDNPWFWHAGAHVTCRKSIGIVAQGKFRAGYPTSQQDFYYVVTFLRVFRWLQKTRAALSPEIPHQFIIPPSPSYSPPTVDVFRPRAHGFGSTLVCPIILIFSAPVSVYLAATFE